MDITETKYSTSMKRLGGTLRTLRKQAGYTIDELAKAVGVSAKTLARIEKSESSVTVDKLFALAEVLKVAPDELIRRAVTACPDGEKEWPEEAVKDLELARDFIKARYQL